MDSILKGYVGRSDEYLLNHVKTLLMRLNPCKSSLKSPPKVIKPITGHQFSFRYRQNSRDYNYNVKRRNTQTFSSRGPTQRIPQNRSSSSSLEIELLLYFQNVFNKLYEINQNTCMVRHDIEKSCNILIIKQFFLDCCVCESRFFIDLIIPIKSKTWVTADDLIVALLAVQFKGDNFFIPNALRKKTERQASVQQSIFFFNIVKFLDGDELGKESLERMASMVSNKPKPQIQAYVANLLQKASDLKNCAVLKVSLSDFFKIIVKD